MSGSSMCLGVPCAEGSPATASAMACPAARAVTCSSALRACRTGANLRSSVACSAATGRCGVSFKVDGRRIVHAGDTIGPSIHPQPVPLSVGRGQTLRLVAARV